MLTMGDNSINSRGSTTSETQTSRTTSIISSNGLEGSSVQLSAEKLNGKNFREWAQSVKLAVDGRGKLGYLTGDSQKPESTDAVAVQRWRSENSLITSWLINSMKPTIGKTYMFLPTAKEVWDAVRETYSDEENASQVFEIKTRLWQMKQGEREVTDYYMEMLALWQELDLSSEEEWRCSEDSALFKKRQEKERVFEFLAGLNRELDDVRGRILSRLPLPSTREVFAEVRREEARRKVMLKEVTATVPEGSALVSRGTYSGPNTRQQKGRPWCEHCRKPGHSKDNCWEVHGKPADWKPRQSPKTRGYQACSEPQPERQQVESNHSDSGSSSHDQLKKIMEMLATLQASGQPPKNTPPGTLAHRGNFPQAFYTFHNHTSWIIDSGASDHMTDSYHLFSSYIPCAGNLRVRIADGSLAPVAGKGSIRISDSITLESDLSSGTTIGNAKEYEGIYYFEEAKVRDQCQSVICNSVSIPKNSDLMLWHSRLGHPNFQYMCHLFPSLCLNKKSLDVQCEVCELAKHRRTSFPKSNYKPTKPFTIIHSDVWGPSRIPNRTHTKWFVTFIDDHTRICWVYLLKDKSEVRSVFINFYAMIQTQFHTKIQILRTDNGTEYFNHTLGPFLQENGIIHQSSCVDTPQQNGVAERKNRHILEVARALLLTTHMPTMFWGDAILTATHLINRMPSRSTLPLRLFGCTAFVHVHPHQRTKLDPRATKCVFLGYSPSQKGYKCYDPISRRLFLSLDVTFFETTPFYPKSSIQGENMSESQTRHDSNGDMFSLDFPLTNLPSNSTSLPVTEGNLNSGGEIEQQNNKETLVYSRRPKPSGNEKLIPEAPIESDLVVAPSNQEPPNNSEQVIEPTKTDDIDLPIALRKQPRSCTLHPIENFVSYNTLSAAYRAFTSNLDRVNIPKNVEEALEIPEWREAVIEEIRALETNGTWEVMKLPRGKRPVGCKWVFTIKYRANGTVERNKARLVAKGFTQIYGIDYTETFAPVAKLNTIRVLLSLAANLDWPLQQLDIKNAFLNGELEEEVYMTLPPGFSKKGEENEVCKLKKSLYGLKQSPKAWFDRFTKVIKGEGYCQGQSDHTMFFKHKNGKKTILIVYVDDIILTGDDIEEMRKLKTVLATEFEVKDLGQMRYFLGMEVARSKKGISVSQRKYTLDLLTETGMLGCKPSDTPVEAGKRTADVGKPVDREKYQKLVGKLIYLSHTRPDIAFAVSVVSQHMQSPKEAHQEAVFKILRYLKGSPGKGLLFKPSEQKEVAIFTDADWAGSIEDRRSTTGYCTFVWGNLVTWKSKKQNVVARSSAEAEFRAVAQGICEGLWLRRILEELHAELELPVKLYCDNKAAINISLNPVQHDRTKHVEVDRHLIKEKVEEGTICMTYVPTKEQIADTFTKGLSRQLFEDFIGKLDMINIYDPT
ncbi:unnamed protein product [Camellia sinensis]